MKVWHWIVLTIGLLILGVAAWARQAISVEAKLDFFNTLFGKTGDIIVGIAINSKIPFKVTVKNVVVEVKVNGTPYYSFTAGSDLVINKGDNSIQANFKEVTVMNFLNIANTLTGSKSLRFRGTVFGFFPIDKETKI